MLQARAQRYLKNSEAYRFLLPIYKRIPPAAAVQSLLDADVVFFSVYVWNFRISLEIARLLKENKADVTIVFGGPHVPDSDQSLLATYHYIDVACHGEGEQTAL